ncbi:MAG: hypothetical protein FWG87_05420 [Defluviitaleaceae bacterium]|nr:hypothetical protein [Defluviitaleaceae bacterium]
MVLKYQPMGFLNMRTRQYQRHLHISASCVCRGVLVGDGFIRPEVASYCVNGRYPTRIDERAYLGADKSAPYIKPLNTDSTDYRGFGGLARGKSAKNLQNTDLMCMERGFNGFTQILRIRSWENISPFSNLRGQNPRKSA